MKLTLTSILCFLFTTGMCQKLEKPIVDKLTGDTTIESQTQYLQGKFNVLAINRPYLSFQIKKKRGLLFLTFIAQIRGNEIFSLLENDSMQVKFDNDSIISFRI